MYSEGEDRYLQDLDCVNIVKAIRELKALSRVMLSQQQRQLLVFERESVLPSNNLVKQLEAEFVQNKVPFEYAESKNKAEYLDKVDKYLDEFKGQALTNMDIKIIDEIVNEDYSSKHDYLEPVSHNQGEIMPKSKFM